MATIYDVASRAKTSISTVSNYLNKSKYVGPEKAKRVKEAVDFYQYVPNRAAKALKTHVSNEIHIILPNLKDPLFSNTYTGIAGKLQDMDYTAVLHLTGDIEAYEKSIIEKVIKASPSGVIICTCQTSDIAQLNRLEKQCNTVFLYRSVSLNRDITTFEFDNFTTVYKLTKGLFANDTGPIHLITGPEKFSCEKDCIDGFIKFFGDAGLIGSSPFPREDILSLPLNKEASFRQLILHYADKELPNCIISSSGIFTTAIKDLYALRNKKDFLLISLGYEAWYNKDLTKTVLQTIRNCEAIGSTAVESLFSAISTPKSHEKLTTICPDEFNLDILEDLSIKTMQVMSKDVAAAPSKTLELLLLDDTQSILALQSLLPDFERKTGISVNIQKKSYNELYDHINALSHDKSDAFDICSVDMPWISDLADNNTLSSLNEAIDYAYLKDENGRYIYPFKLSLSNKKLYGIPYLIGLQLLFYRKDLFNDQYMKEQYYNTYGVELAPPTDWFNFNQIAKHFTKKYNALSPTTYGTCLADYFDDSVLGEILPRIWGYNGQLIDGDNVTHFSSPPVKKAFESYIETTKYGTLEKSHYAEEVARAFSKGDIAMITSYVSYAPIIYDLFHSDVNGLVDFAPMPSNSSMVSGWSMCVNQNSRLKSESILFLKWFLSLDISYRYSLITGNPTRHQLYQNTNLNKLYPWLSLATLAFEKGHTRSLLSGKSNFSSQRLILEKAISHIIAKHKSSKSSINSLLKQADRDFTKATYH